jgi:RNA polymerase sigma-70 factor (ECF subfamily)
MSAGNREEGALIGSDGDLSLPTSNDNASAAAAPEQFADFTELFNRYQRAITAYIYRIVGDPDLAEDLAQDTFIRAYQAYDRLRPDSNVVAWLYTIATNVARNSLRRRRIVSWIPLANLLPFLSSSSATSAQRQDGFGGGHSAVGLGVIADPAEQKEEAETVERALSILTPEQRTSLLLHVHEGFSVAEIAQITSSSEAAVKTRLFRARQAFREAYLRLQQEDEQ